MLRKRLFTLIFSLVLFPIIFSSAAFAEEELDSGFNRVDLCFERKNESALDLLLKDYSGQENFKEIEDYVQVKIGRLVVDGDYDFAMKAILVLIQNDLDNDDAVALYSIISDAWNEQQEVAKETEAKKAELAAKKTEQEAKKTAAPEEKTEQQSAAAENVIGPDIAKVEEQRVTKVTGVVRQKTTVQENKILTNAFKFNIGIADFSVLMNLPLEENFLTSPDFLLNYGLSFYLDYKGGKGHAGCGFDCSAAYRFVSITAEKKFSQSLNLLEAELIPEFGIGGKGAQACKIYLRCGFGAYGMNYSLFTTPVAGISIKNIPFIGAKVMLKADYYVGCNFYPEYKFAGGGELGVSIPYAELKRVNLTFDLSVKDKVLLLSDGKIQNQANAVIALGICSRVKK